MSGLLCSLLGKHRCRYVEGDEAEVRAECLRWTCSYEKELIQDWAEQRRQEMTKNNPTARQNPYEEFRDRMTKQLTYAGAVAGFVLGVMVLIAHIGGKPLPAWDILHVILPAYASVTLLIAGWWELRHQIKKHWRSSDNEST